MNKLKFNRGCWVELMTCLLVLLWVYTAASKLVNVEEFKGQLENQVFGKGFTKVLFYVLPSSELVAAGLLCWGKSRWIGFGLSLVLMLTFTGYITLILAGFYPRVPCSCGGVISALGWKGHLVFNLFFVAVAAIGYILTFKERRPEN